MITGRLQAGCKQLRLMSNFAPLSCIFQLVSEILGMAYRLWTVRTDE